MSDSLCRNVEVVNKLGLHARAAAKLVQLATKFSANISVCFNERTVNAKSIMGVMMLAASKGSQILLQADGDDAKEALEQLGRLFAERFGETE